MRFHKYHGIGNDFVLIEDLEGRYGPAGTLPAAFVAAVCDRHTGVGADGVIRMLGPEADPTIAEKGAELRMDYYNADGGAAEMCGNGIRCLAVMARSQELLAESEHTILTGAGPVLVRFPEERMVSVEMGEPKLAREEVPMVGNGPSLRVGVETEDGRVWEGTGVSMGNPHFVLFSDDLPGPVDDELVRSLGPALEVHRAFPDRTNVEFVDVVNRGELKVRVWERGVGETMACGSGACAVLAAAASRGLAERSAQVHLPGGTLEIEWTPAGSIWMTGGAERVFEGELSPAWLAARKLAGESFAPAGADEQKEDQ